MKSIFFSEVTKKEGEKDGTLIENAAPTLQKKKTHPLVIIY